jgi:uncharacterized phage protein gp47/JayE
MPLVPPTQDEIYQRFKAAMEAVGFTHWSQGSRIGAIGLTQAAYLAELWETLSQIEEQINPGTARGIYLNRIGEMFGVKRLPAQTASTLGKGPSIQFTNNGGTTVTVPAGTRVWNPDQPEIAFFTTEALVLNGAQQGFVDVVAGAAGDLHNVGAGTLTNHNAGMNQLTVLNVRPIGGGALPESDESYRFRITQALSARNGATVTAIQQALLALPGVRDVLVRSNARGNGSIDVILVPIDRVADQTLLDAAEDALATVVAAGISWRVTTPIVRRVDLDIQLQMKSPTTVDDVRVNVDAAVRAYLDNLRPSDGGGGDMLIFAELLSRIMDAHPNILDAAVSMRLDGDPLLQTNISPTSGERLVSGSVVVT